MVVVAAKTHATYLALKPIPVSLVQDKTSCTRRERDAKHSLNREFELHFAWQARGMSVHRAGHGDGPARCELDRISNQIHEDCEGVE